VSGFSRTETGAESLWRLRLDPEMTVGDTVFAVSYEQRMRLWSGSPALATAALLPSTATPFRIRQLDWSLAQSSHAAWRHGIDRASARLQAGAAVVTAGRQAIGWGRGVLFGAVDLFAPFQPLEVDREWRAGVDALRADVKLTDRSSFDVVGAFGRTLDESAVAGRVRGYIRDLDLRVVGGRRATDTFAGLSTSAAVGDGELHGEVAAFAAPAAPPRSRGGVVWKAVAGGSFRVPVGSGLITYVEYHYSGFGAPRPEQIVPLLGTPDFAARYLRGDMQILSRHAIGVIGQYEHSPLLAFSGQWMQNARDRSGIAVPGVTMTFTDALSLLATGYLPYGRGPAGSLLRSEFGAAPLGALLQLRLYR